MTQRFERRCSFILLCAVIAGAAVAQQSPHSMHFGAGTVPPEILERPTTLRTGIGTAHQQVSTASPRAQAFYDQGLAYLHAYVWIEAVRSFHQALRMDPNLAMAWLGIAAGSIGLQDVAAAKAACDKAQESASHMNATEHAWLEVRTSEVAALESGSADALAAYRKTVDDAIAAHPGDPWLLVQGGLAAESSPLLHGQSSNERSLAYYQRALAVDPHNLAALHYTLHADENLGRTKDALDRARLYAELVPAVPHAQHMYGHELMRSGHTEEAIEQYKKAEQIQEQYVRTSGVPAQYDWHFGHNLQLLGLCYELTGQMHAASAQMRPVFALPAATDFLAYNRRVWPELLLNEGRYQEALDAARAMAASQWPMAQLAGHTIAGEALLALLHPDQAEDELKHADEAATHIAPQLAASLPHPGLLRSALLLQQGQTEAGEQVDVNAVEAALATPGPDAWLQALFTLEAVTRDAIKAGDWPLAHYTAVQMIQHDPYYAGGHFYLGLVAVNAGEVAGAKPMFAEAVRLWSRADPDMPQLLAAKKMLEGPTRKADAH